MRFRQIYARHPFDLDVGVERLLTLSPDELPLA